MYKEYVNLESIMLSEISQTGKDKFHMLLLMCGFFFKFKFMKKTMVHEFDFKKKIPHISGTMWNLSTA